MATIPWLNCSHGKIDVLCQGEKRSISLFLHHAVQAHLHFEKMYWLSSHQIAFTIPLTDFYRMVRLMRQYKLRMKILKKHGFPFWLAHLRRNKSFYVGVLLFICLLFLFSSFVWQIDIKGLEHIPEERVRTLLKQEGVYVGQVKYRINDPESIRQRLLSRLPESAWVGFQLEGTRVLITIVEKKRIERLKDPVPSFGPVHLVAKKDAMITDMQVEKGNPVVGVHDIVEKGDLLVSGIYGELEKESSGNIIGAKGKVLGEVWYEADVEVPTLQIRNELTGESEKEIQLYFRSWVLAWPFFQPKFQDYEIVDRIRPLYLGKWQLPFGWIEKNYLRTKKVKDSLKVVEAVSLGQKRAAEELKQKLGKDGKILVEKVLHQRVENGKVYLKIHFDVVENIAVPKPILQGE